MRNGLHISSGSKFSPAVVPMLNFDRQADIEIEVDKSEKRVVLRHI
jgi:hypothetical protein